MREDIVQELKRKKRVVNLMLTAHSILEQRFQRISTAIDIGLMVGSLFLLIVSVIGFFNGKMASPWGIIDLNVFGICASTVLFAISMTEWRVAWKTSAHRHKEAVKAYSAIKCNLADLLADSANITDDDIRKVNEMYQRIGDELISIPERDFLKLKQAHYRKLYVSRLSDKYPFASAWIIRTRMWLKHMSGALHDEPR